MYPLCALLTARELLTKFFDQLIEHSTWKLVVVGSIPGLGNLTITNCCSDETLNHVMVLYSEHVKKPGGALSSFVLYPCTISLKIIPSLSLSLSHTHLTNNEIFLEKLNTLDILSQLNAFFFMFVMTCNFLSIKYFVRSFDLIISVYLSSLPVAHLSDAPRRLLVVTGDSARIQDETTENSAWFFNVHGV